MGTRLHGPFILFAFFLYLALLDQASGQSVGINYGRLSQFYTRLPPSTVVPMFKANGVTKVKIFDAEAAVLSQLKNTGIEVMVTVPNNQLSLLAGSASAARDWISQNVTSWVKSGCDIRWVAAGNEALNEPFNGVYVPVLYPAMQNLYQALQAEGLASQVKLTTLLNVDFLTNTYPPSLSVVKTDLQDLIKNIGNLLVSSQSRLFVNFYPYLVVFQQKIQDLSFALFQGGSQSFTDSGTNLQYTNLFDASYDGVVLALKKLNLSSLEIGIGETGWPDDGEPKATVTNAQLYNQQAINKILGGAGTPAHPNKVLDAYIFSWLDEDLKDLGSGTIPFERHFGIFDIQGTPKYNLNLQGGAAKPLTGAVGVKRLRNQWCIAKPGATGLDQVIQYTCTNGPDCSALSTGASCYASGSQMAQASFAMNGFYQIKQQDSASCDFQGKGQVVSVDPSTSTCRMFVGLDAGWLLDSTSAASLLHWQGWPLVATFIGSLFLFM